MWHVLKAEFEYNKNTIIFAYCIAFLAFIAGLVWELAGVYSLVTITFLLVFFSIAGMGSRTDKERRDRFYVKLPISLKQTSILRFLFPLLFYLGIFVLWIGAFFIHHIGHENHVFWSLIGMSALLFILIAFFTLYHDLGHFNTGKYRIIYICCLLLFFAGLVQLLIKGYLSTKIISFGNNIHKTFWDAGGYALICFGMLYLNHHIFLRRKSYVA